MSLSTWRLQNRTSVLSTCCFVYTMIEQSCVLDVVHRTTFHRHMAHQGGPLCVLKRNPMIVIVIWTWTSGVSGETDCWFESAVHLQLRIQSCGTGRVYTYSRLTECFYYLRNVQDLLTDRETPYEIRFGEPCKGSILSFAVVVEHHSISARDLSIILQFGKIVLSGIFLGFELIAEEFGQEIFWQQKWKIWKSTHRIFILEEPTSVTDDRANISGRNLEFRESTARRQPTVWRKDFSRELHDELEESQPTEPIFDRS